MAKKKAETPKEVKAPEPKPAAEAPVPEPKPALKRNALGFVIYHDPATSGIGFGHAK